MRIPIDIKSIIDQLMASPKFRAQWTEHLIHSKWTEWVGKRMALHIRPWKLKDNKLIVMIDDDKWKIPLEEFKDKILSRMEKDLGALAIREFSIIMGTPKKQSKKRKVQDQHPPAPPLKKSPKLNMALEAELTLIKDPSVKTALTQLIDKAQSFDQKGHPYQ